MILQILHNFDLEGGKVNLEDRYAIEICRIKKIGD